MTFLLPNGPTTALKKTRYGAARRGSWVAFFLFMSFCKGDMDTSVGSAALLNMCFFTSKIKKQTNNNPGVGLLALSTTSWVVETTDSDSAMVLEAGNLRSRSWRQPAPSDTLGAPFLPLPGSWWCFLLFSFVWLVSVSLPVSPWVSVSKFCFPSKDTSHWI